MLTWDNSYSVGVKELDDQHRKMIEFINDLELGMQASDSRDSMVKVLNGLVAYTKDHFANEEFYFRQFDYDKTEDHIQEHLKLISEVQGLVYKFELREALDQNKVMEFLKTWLVDHILGADKKYVDCFSRNGLV